MSLDRRGRILAAGWGFLLAVVLGLLIAARPTATEESGSTYNHLRLFNEVLALIRNSYVETVPEKQLLAGAYEGLLAALDGESEYLTAAQYAELSAPQPGADADPGIFLTRRDGVLFVAAVLPGSDAEARGLRLGDQVRRIGDRNGRDLTLTEAERALRGPAASKVTLSISRRDDPKREDLELVRRKLVLPPPHFEGMREGVAVVRLPAFGPGAAKSLGGILEKLQKDKVGRAVFDLRGSAWGDPGEALRAAALVAGGEAKMRLASRGGEETVLSGPAGRSPWNGEILLLTDTGTSFAAEVFVASLVDSGAARQAGETTLGRGGEREGLPLANGDYLYLTVRKFMTVSGKSWHGSGLIPSVPLPPDGTLTFKERADQQMRRAVEYLRDLVPEARAA